MNTQKQPANVARKNNQQEQRGHPEGLELAKLGSFLLFKVEFRIFRGD